MEHLVNFFWIGIFTGGFCLILAFGELIMNALYKFVPPYRKWVDKHIENMPDWSEEVK